MLSPLKLHGDKACSAGKTSRKKLTCYLQGKFFFSRLLSNYEISEGALLPCQDVLEHCNQVKENVSCGIPLGNKNLSLLVKGLYGRIK